MKNNLHVREDVVREVARDLLSILSDEEYADLHPSELLSVAFTLAMHISTTVLEHSTGEVKAHNQNEIINAIMLIYDAVRPEKMH